jgi:hypothetical protein
VCLPPRRKNTDAISRRVFNNPSSFFLAIISRLCFSRRLGGSFIAFASLGGLAVQFRIVFIGVYRRPSAAKLVLDVIRLYLRLSICSL